MSEDLDVVEFGPATTPEPERRPARWRALADAGQISLGLTVLGGAAAIASLTDDWQTIDTTRSGEEFFAHDAELTSTVWNVAVGTPYLGGLMLLGALTALALFGPPTARAAARVAGIGAATALAVVLGAAAKTLGSVRDVPQFFGMGDEMLERFTAKIGGGLLAALAAVVLLAAALLVAQRHERNAARRAAAAEAEEPDDYESGDIELTVTTAAPFIRQY